MNSHNDFDRLFLLSAGANVVSLGLFLIWWNNGQAQWFYHACKYYWALQYLILFDLWHGNTLLVPKAPTEVLQVIVAYGFGADFFILLQFATGSRTATLNYDIAMRCATNMCHHLWIFTARYSFTGSHLQPWLCAVGWSIHLFPWFQYTQRMDLFKIACKMGNLAPLFALIAWYGPWAEVRHGKDVHGAVLLQLFLYRSLYSTCHFQFFSKDLAILSSQSELYLGKCLKHVSFAVSVFIAIYLSPVWP